MLPEVLVAANVDVPAIAQLGGYGLASDRNRRVARRVLDARATTHACRSSRRISRGSRRSKTTRSAVREELPKLVAGYKTEAAYPATPIGRSLALAAQIVGSKLGTRVIYVQHGSFDTHITQKATQDRLLGRVLRRDRAFYADLAAHGNDKRVLTMTFSEFGRRVAENASRGTDHGEAAPLFLIGGGVKGGLYGDNPVIGQEASATSNSRPTSAASTPPSSNAGSTARPSQSSPARSQYCPYWGS